MRLCLIALFMVPVLAAPGPGDALQVVVLRDGYMARSFDATGKKLTEVKTGSKAQDLAISSDGKTLAFLRDAY